MATVAFGAVTYSVVRMSDEYLLNQRIDERREETGATAVSVAPFLSSKNAYGMYELIVERARRTGGRYLVLNTSGVVTADSSSLFNGQRTVLKAAVKILILQSDFEYQYNKSEGNIYYAHPIVSDAQMIGAVVFIDSVKDLESSINRLTANIVLISFSGALLLIIASVIMTGYMTKPIVNLKQAADKLSLGRFSERVEATGKDEIADLARAFNNMAQKLQDIDKSRSDFVANASHELKTPLSSMKILIESLIYEKDVKKSVYKEFLLDINMEIDRLSDIVSDLLHIMKLSESGDALSVSPVSLRGIIKSVIGRLMPLSVSQGKRMELADSIDIICECDGLKISQAINNLVDNAIKYTKADGYIKVSMERDEDDALIIVEDNGQGISAEHQKHIFDRFYRVDAARARETGGTGLGLYITQQIATLHSGKLEVVSEEGVGSIFTLRLPISREDVK